MSSIPSTPPSQTRAVFHNMLKGSSLYLVAQLAPSLVGLVMVPIVTRRLTQADYGALDLLQQISVVVSVLLGAKFTVALGFFYAEPGAHRSRVVGTALSGAALLGCLAGTVGWALAEPLSRFFLQSPDYAVYLRILFASLPAAFLLDGGLGWLRVEDRAALFSGLSLVRLLCASAGAFVLLTLGWGMGGVIWASTLAAVLVAAILAVLAARRHGLGLHPPLFLRLLRFAVPSTLSGLALFVIHFADRFVLPLYRPLEDLALYAVAYKLGMLLNPLQTAFEAYWSAQIYALIHREDARLVVARTFTYLTLAMSAAGLGILFFASPAIRLLAAPSYSRATELVPVILAAYYLRALGDFFRYIFLACGVPVREAISNAVTATVAIAAYFLLIPTWGSWGAAWSTVLTFAVSGLLSVVWSYRTWPFFLETQRLWKLAVVTLALTVAHFLLPSPLTLAGAVARAGLLALFPALLWAGRFATPGEIDILRRLGRRWPGLA